MLGLLLARDQIGQNEVPPALPPQVLALLSTQEQINRLQTEQREASAASDAMRMMEDIVAQRQRSASAPTDTSTSPRPPNQSMVQQTASRNLALNENEPAVIHSWDRQSRTTGIMADALGPSQNSARAGITSHEQEVITKHVVHALRNEPGMNDSDIQMAVERINGIIRSAPALSMNGDAAEQNPRLRHMAAESRVSRVPSDHLPHVQARGSNRDEPESEASKFGVALQIGEVVKPQNVGKNGNKLKRDYSPKRSKGALSEEDDRGTNALPFDSEDRKLPVRVTIPFTNGDNFRTRIKTISSPTAALGSFSNMSSTRSSFSIQMGVEGVFSDAEDEEATEIIESAKQITQI